MEEKDGADHAEEPMVPSPTGLGNPSPGDGGVAVKSIDASNEVTLRRQLQDVLVLVERISGALESERIAAVDRETRLMREVQLITSRMKDLEEEVVELRSAIVSGKNRSLRQLLEGRRSRGIKTTRIEQYYEYATTEEREREQYYRAGNCRVCTAELSGRQSCYGRIHACRSCAECCCTEEAPAI